MRRRREEDVRQRSATVDVQELERRQQPDLGRNRPRDVVPAYSSATRRKGRGEVEKRAGRAR